MKRRVMFRLPLVRGAQAAAVALVLLTARPPADAAAFAALGYTAPVPASWQAQPPSSQYRLAQYRVPGGAGDAEVVVFYFGKGQGGSVAANVARWSSQFTSADGRPVTPTTQMLSIGDVPVTVVELHGTYARGVGVGPQGQGRPGQTLLVAVVETPDGNITIQLHGPQATVAANRRHFDAMVRGFRKGA